MQNLLLGYSPLKNELVLKDARVQPAIFRQAMCSMDWSGCAAWNLDERDPYVGWVFDVFLVVVVFAVEVEGTFNRVDDAITDGD